jgi:hypothetical protein
VKGTIARQPNLVDPTRIHRRHDSGFDGLPEEQVIATDQKPDVFPERS